VTVSTEHRETWVLVVNCGSSTLKAAVVNPSSGARRVSAVVEDVHSPADATGQLLDRWADDLDGVVAVGHRVVHGGAVFRAPALVDDHVVATLEGLVALAPLQIPAALAALEAARRCLPDLPQVAVFDTAFHQTVPEVAHRYAVPQEWFDLGVRRYGFHGLSHRYVTGRAAELLDRPIEELRLVSLHLGNGCSGAAVLGGRSIDTTMGLTPLEGLVMGTRSGDIDPGALAYVGRRLGLGLDEVVATLNERSGLLGLSGISPDCRVLSEEARKGSSAARMALDVFSYRAAKAVGALAVALGGIDALVLTGGIGERAADVRSALLSHLAVLGLEEDVAANSRHGLGTAGRVSPPGHPVALVVPTDEELVIARDAAEVAAG
jgi:acetate kinase